MQCQEGRKRKRKEEMLINKIDFLFFKFKYATLVKAKL